MSDQKLFEIEKIWDVYKKYIEAVKNKTPENLSLREKDRYLWGKSFYGQFKKDLKTNFGQK